jgi:hypothetical protein
VITPTLVQMQKECGRKNVAIIIGLPEWALPQRESRDFRRGRVGTMEPAKGRSEPSSSLSTLWPRCMIDAEEVRGG